MAGFYGDETIEEIREANPIEDVIGSYVSLKRQGSNLVGLCPFHNEKTPSFSVSPSKQMFYCFGCHASGNVFTFLMKYENMTFPESIKALAARAGITLTERSESEEDRRRRTEREKLLEINKEAAIYFYRALRAHEGEAALSYFRKRELSDETMKNFGLGYSLTYRDDLYRHLKSKGYDDDILRRSGLVKFSEEYGMHDLFWNRAMFPIQDMNGKVIAFGGRVMGDAKPKYVNSPDSPVFDKSRNMYGLFLARKTREDSFILCEGYMDVIALHQAGFNNALASLGTALTQGHCTLMKRFNKKIYISYDSDGAGAAAAVRAVPMLHDAGMQCYVINMSPYKDPDEFIKALGSEEYKKRIEEAENGFMFTVRKASERYDLKDPGEKTKFFSEAARMLLTLDGGVERSNYIDAVSDKYKVSAEDLKALIIRESEALSKKPQRKVYVKSAEGEELSPDTTLSSDEDKKKLPEGMAETYRMYLYFLYSVPGAYQKGSAFIGIDDFFGVYREIYDVLEKEILGGGEINPARVVNIFPDEKGQQEAGRVFSYTGEEYENSEERGKAFKETLLRIKKESLKNLSGGGGESAQNLFYALKDERKKLSEIEKTVFLI